MLISAKDIFKKSWRIFRANYLIFWRVVGWLLLPAVLLVVLDLVDGKLGEAFIWYSVPIYLALQAAAFILGLWVGIILIRLINKSLEQSPLDLRPISREAWRDTISYLWVSVLVGVIVVVGLFFFVIPGLILAVWYSFALIIFVLEGKKGYGALRASKELVDGRFWAVVWRWLAPNFVYFLILAVAIGLPALAIGYSTGFDSLASRSHPWWFVVWQSLVAILTAPLSAGFGVILYNSLKETGKKS